MFIVFLASLFNRLFFKLLLLNYARTFSVSRDFKEGDMGIFCIAVLWCFSCGISVILPLRYGNIRIKKMPIDLIKVSTEHLFP